MHAGFSAATPTFPAPPLLPAPLRSFPMPKDSLLHARLQREGLGRTFKPAPPDAATLCLAHDPAYVQAFLDGSIDAAAMRRIGLPWSPALVQRTLIGVGSAILAARLALQLGVAVMCNGGTHHAHYRHGSGGQLVRALPRHVLPMHMGADSTGVLNPHPTHHASRLVHL